MNNTIVYNSWLDNRKAIEFIKLILIIQLAYFSIFWKHTFAKIGEDWVFLALLGIIMALLSFVMDCKTEMK